MVKKWIVKDLHSCIIQDGGGIVIDGIGKRNSIKIKYNVVLTSDEIDNIHYIGVLIPNLIKAVYLQGYNWTLSIGGSSIEWIEMTHNERIEMTHIQ